ncbi:MAG: hypothetical protein ACYDGR_01725 [Candidatus Dormibacteria bacterium]
MTGVVMYRSETEMLDTLNALPDPPDVQRIVVLDGEEIRTA